MYQGERGSAHTKPVNVLIEVGVQPAAATLKQDSPQLVTPCRNDWELAAAYSPEASSDARKALT